jgi:hypothetical protein
MPRVMVVPAMERTEAMRQLMGIVLAGLLAGCSADLRCKDHRRLASDPTASREGINRAVRIEIDRAEIFKEAPTLKCPECDKLIARVLAASPLQP